MNEITEKWDASGLLDGLSDLGKEKMAQLLENTRIYMESNPTKIEQQMFNILLPLVRRTMNSFVEKDSFMVASWPQCIVDGKSYVSTTRWMRCKSGMFILDKSKYTIEKLNIYSGLELECEIVDECSIEIKKCLEFLYVADNLGTKTICYIPIIPCMSDGKSNEIAFLTRYKNI